MAVRPKPHYDADNIAILIQSALEEYPLWMAHEYPTRVVPTSRHGVRGVTLTLSTGRVFDIKIKERRR